jgi:hypothetical protein
VARASKRNIPRGIGIEKEPLMGFVQIIEFRTSKPDEMRALGNEWEQVAGGKRKVQRRVLCEDRDDRGRFVNIVFFDSYEDAMENSSLPETDSFSKRMAGLTDGSPTFVNLEVVEDR